MKCTSLSLELIASVEAESPRYRCIKDSTKPEQRSRPVGVTTKSLDEKLITIRFKVIMEGKVFQRCTHLLCCSVLSLGGNVNTRRMSKPDMGSIFHIKKSINILVIGNYYVNYQNYQSLMLLTSSNNKRSLMHLFLFTNSAQSELVSICAQSIRNCN